MDPEKRADLVLRHVAEAVTPEEVRALFERTDRPRAYIGFEPSGPLTVAHLIPARTMLDLREAGAELTVFLADWHAFVNDKLGSDLDRIRASGEAMTAAFRALGVDGPSVRYRWASELVRSPGYWERVLRVAKATTLARTRRAMSILGRDESATELDTAKLFYPSMQVADIFELPVDLAYGGLDQRRAHVLAREVAHHYHWPVPAAIHTPLLSALSGGGRMDPTDGGVERKMSKSDPSSSIALAAPPEEIEAKVRAAYCPRNVVDGNPVVEAARFIVLPWERRLVLERSPAHGGTLEFTDGATFVDAYARGELHPLDLKAAVAAALARIAAPARAAASASGHARPTGGSPSGDGRGPRGPS